MTQIGDTRNIYASFDRISGRERDYMEDLRIDGRTVFDWV
jgi:hypothetical protein